MLRHKALVTLALVGAAWPTTSLLPVAAAEQPATETAKKETPPVASPEIEALYQTLLKAMINNNFPDFARPLNAETRAILTKALFEDVHKQLKPRFDSGYKSHYLGDLKKNGQIVYLWKLTFEDNGDDAMVQMALKEDGVSGIIFS